MSGERCSSNLQDAMTTLIRRRLRNRPESILDAASKVLGRSSPREMTIEAVAAQAGLSKGGVLQQYASKDSLIRALVDRKVEELRRGVASCAGEREADVNTRTAFLVRHLRRRYAQEGEFSRALLVASIDNPSALEGYRSFVAEQVVISSADEAPPPRSTVVFLAIMGLLLGRALKLHDVSGGEADKLFDAFENLVDDD